MPNFTVRLKFVGTDLPSLSNYILAKAKIRLIFFSQTVESLYKNLGRWSQLEEWSEPSSIPARKKISLQNHNSTNSVPTLNFILQFGGKQLGSIITEHWTALKWSEILCLELKNLFLLISIFCADCQEFHSAKFKF